MAKQSRFLKTDRQISELVMALKGRDEVPLKFEYLEEGASYWNDLMSSEEYKLGNTEINLISEHIKEIAEYLDLNKISLIDIGCGSGVKGAIISQKLINLGLQINYAALDISESMLVGATEEIKRIKDIHNVEFHKVDFEEGNFAYITNTLRKLHDCNNLLLLLGHTLGNPADKNRLLTNLRESMTSKDFILIGVELLENQAIDEILSHYKNEKLYNLLFNVLQKLGVKRVDGHFDIVFNEDKSQVEMRFVFDKKVIIDYAEEKIEFEKDQVILLAISYRFTKQVLKDLLEDTGFKVRSIILNNENTYALVLGQTRKL